METAGAEGKSVAETPSQIRTVWEMMELVLRITFRKRIIVVAVSLPVWLLIFAPKAAADWLGLKMLRVSMVQALESFSLGELDAQSVRDLMEVVGPATGVSLVSNLLGGVSLLVSLIAGPLWVGALTLLVVGVATGGKVGVHELWRGAARRGLQLILTEFVKMVLLWVVLLAGVLLGVVVTLVGIGVVDSLFGGIAPLALLGIMLVVVAGGMVMFGPAVYLFLLWLFTVPIVLFEKKDVTGALRRSAEMVRSSTQAGFLHSHAMRLTGLLTLAGLLIWVASLPAAAPWMVWFSKAMKDVFEMDPSSLLRVPGSVVLTSSLLLIIPKVFLSSVFPGAIGAYYLDTRARTAGDRAADVPDYLKALCSGDGGDLPEPRLGISSGPPRAAATVGLVDSSVPEKPPHWPNG